MPPPKSDETFTLCDIEPINTPGSIQSHGVLVAIQEPEMSIVEISANAHRVFGVRAKRMLGTHIKNYLSKKHYQALLGFVEQSKWSRLQPMTLSIRGGGEKGDRITRKWDAFCHRHAEILFIELEPSMSAAETLPYYRELRATFGRIYASKSAQSLFDNAAQAVREVTDFDRVMVYRFDADWNGEVIAESKKNGIKPFLNRYFPASDMPRQARAAFLNNYVRMIPNIRHKPVPLMNLSSRVPLDLSKSILRSVSPIHLQYLENLGVHATLTVSLIKNDRLWGIIACHHRTKKSLFHEMRLACELIGKSVSALLPSRERADEAVAAKTLRKARNRLRNALDRSDNIRSAISENPAKLLSIVNAEGAAVCVDEEQTWLLIGNTPSHKQVADLATWLSSHMTSVRSTFSTHRLSELYREGAKLRATACGVLAVKIPKAKSNYIIWFRPEWPHHITWAGHPRKSIQRLPDGNIKITPRTSFEDWEERIKLRSRPWSASERSSALTARDYLVSVDLRLQFELAQQTKLAQQALTARDDFLAIASHELKTPLTSIRLQSQIASRRLKDDDTGAEANARTRHSLQRVDENVDRVIRLVDDMLDMARISSGKLSIKKEKTGIVSLAADVIERLQDEFQKNHVPLHLIRGDEVYGSWDRFRVEQCLTNLLTNALRYGQKSPVTVTAGAIKGSALLSVRDEGPGIETDSQKRVFEKFEGGGAETQGLGLGLHICKKIIELHGGQIWVESRLGEGASFYISLPLLASEERADALPR